MVACLDVEGWCVCTPSEVAQFLDRSRTPSEHKRRFGLAVRTHLKPVDVYAYLKARFGEPNGFQNFLRKDDSDNLVHWDFNLRAGDEDVYISGTGREVHFLVTEDLSDEHWKKLINGIKRDFRRVAQEKSAIVRSLEKYIVFQNKFAALANLCADLHERILDAPPPVDAELPGEEKDALDAYREAMAQRSKRIESLFGDCLKLRLLMPIMAEAYINMLILTFCKSAIRDDRGLYEDFLRAKIPHRLVLLTENCDGFEKPVDESLSAYGDFMRIISQRNYSLHGNIDPEREPVETVYFDKRRPLFVNPGHNIDILFEQMERQADAPRLLEDYENLHGFLVEISECLSPRHKAFFEQVISDAYPGFEVRKRRPTRLFPDHVVWGGLQGTRYDDQLNVDW